MQEGRVDVAEEDPQRDRLLDAAARVFARRGYAGARIADILEEAGLSTGAVYGRFASKDDLLRAAVVRRSPHAARLHDGDAARIADVLAQAALVTDSPLSDEEAVRLEAFVAARREPQVAAALAEAQAAWRCRAQGLVDAAVADGSLDPALDADAVVFFARTLLLGLLVQRGSGLPGPDPAAWAAVVERIVAGLAAPATPPTPATSAAAVAAR